MQLACSIAAAFVASDTDTRAELLGLDAAEVIDGGEFADRFNYLLGILLEGLYSVDDGGPVDVFPPDMTLVWN